MRPSENLTMLQPRLVIKNDSWSMIPPYACSCKGRELQTRIERCIKYPVMLSKKLKVVFSLTGVLLAGCSTAPQTPGAPTLTLSVQQAVQLEEYFRDPASAAIAVSAETGVFGTVRCPSGTCVYPYGSAEKEAIHICETLSDACAPLATKHEIVWKGPISLPSATSGNLPAQFSFRTASSLQTAAGIAHLNEGRQSGTVMFGKPPNDCNGVFNAVSGDWSMSCGAQFRTSGRLVASGDSQFTGTSYEEDMVLKISRGNWPKLQSAVAAHPPSQSHSGHNQ